MAVNEGLDIKGYCAFILCSELYHLYKFIIDIETEETISIYVWEVIHVLSDSLKGKDGRLGCSVLTKLDQWSDIIDG